MYTRRRFLEQMSLASGAMVSPAVLPTIPLPDLDPPTPGMEVTSDDLFWHQIKQAYTVSPSLINLNNGGVCPQPRVVQEAVERYNQWSNETPSYYMWRVLDKGRESIREKLADLAGCDHEEIAINRNSSEALETIIFGLRLQAGDEVVLTKQDYPNMINAWKQRAMRDGIKLVWLDFDFPIEDENQIVQTFESAFTDQTKVVHVTHLINWIGQILPVRQIADRARERGIQILVDAAHTFAHVPYRIPDLGADYFGTSLHKWLCAPFGSGLLWVKKERIREIYPLLAAPDAESDDIRKFEHLGTRSFAIEQAIGQAVDFHYLIGSERKFKRLHYLKNYWMDRVKDFPGVKLHTSADPRFGGAIGMFSIASMDPGKVSNRLFKDFNVHTVPIRWENINGVRVTPNVYTLTADLDRFIDAVGEIAREG